MSDTNKRFSRMRRGAEQTGPRAKFRELLPYLFEHKKILFFVIVLSVLGAAASLAQPVLVSQVISLVSDNSGIGALVWVLVALVVASGIISGYQHYLLQRTGESVVLSSRRRLVARMLHLPISEFDNRRTGDLVSRVGSDTTLLRAVLTQGLVEAIGGSLTFIGALIAMLVIDPVLLGFTVLVLAVSVVVITSLASRIRVASQQAQDRVGDLAAAVERSVSAIRTVRAAGAQEREERDIDEHSVGAWRMGLRVAKISAFVVPVAATATQISFLVVLGVGGFRVASGAISVASLVAFIIFLFMMIMPLGQAFGAVTSVNTALGALGRIQEIVNTPAEDAEDVSAANDPATNDSAAKPVAGTPALEFREVSFSYPAHKAASPEPTAGTNTTVPVEDAITGPVRVLNDVSFAVPAGARVALVGPSGAGKSTILSLIERFYDVESGEILLDGVDIRALGRQRLRSQLGYVEQDAPVLAGSLRDNLTLAAPDASDAECEHVLELVNLSGVLQRDPAGLGAAVGENGVLLSGGEQQRLAIARTLLAAPPILLLDESTSSLDGQNEELIRQAIDAVSTGRTVIVIAHRLSTVVDSDLIVVVENGTIQASGTHSELLDASPLYRDLAKHQLLV